MRILRLMMFIVSCVLMIVCAAKSYYQGAVVMSFWSGVELIELKHELIIRNKEEKK